MRIFCDFDGTITCQDTADLVLDRLADPEWEAIEAEWTSGAIDAATCMSRQIPLIRGSLRTIESVLDEVTLRDGFVELLDWAQRRDIPVSIVSDGVDYFINYVLRRNGIRKVPLIANRLVSDGHEGWSLKQLWRIAGCSGGSGVCKCNVISAFTDDRPLVFIGDGRSDFCVAARPDLLFATAGLERFCIAEDIAHHPFTSFNEVRSALDALLLPSGKLTAFA
jgi:2,3-diketo-5-methylthio-1-phosphopentane phosphatase